MIFCGNKPEKEEEGIKNKGNIKNATCNRHARKE